MIIAEDYAQATNKLTLFTNTEYFKYIILTRQKQVL